MIIVAIDVGLVNMGFAVYDTSKEKFLETEKVSLVQRQKQLSCRDQIGDLVWQRLVLRYKTFFNDADVVLIERQMKRREIVIETVIRTMMFMLKKQVVVVAPISVKKMFGTSCRDHSLNKAAAVETVKALAPETLRGIPANKQDDVSDAVLMCLYWDNKNQGISSVNNPVINKITKLEKKPKLVRKRKLASSSSSSSIKRRKK